ncbi:MAG: hypothetical protein JXA82_06625 [Sedimentisphaerales bacterium]|nr:hypothetical protein [Sedimentisphaerales bacterium]
MGVEQTKKHAWWRGASVFAVAWIFSGAVNGGMIETGRPLVWGLDNQTLKIPAGYVLTDALITIRQETLLSESRQLSVYVLNNPSIGLHSYGSHEQSVLQETAQPAATITLDSSQSTDTMIDLEKCDKPDSWVWDIFRRPFLLEISDSEPALYSSSLLELVDYAGTDTGFGLAFLTDGEPIQWESLELRVIAGPLGITGPQISRTYTITQETFSKNDLSQWQPLEVEIPSVSSFWRLKDNTLATQPVGNQPIPSDTPTIQSSCLAYQRYSDLRNFQTQITITPQTSGSVGVLFRYKDDNNYFRFSWNSLNGRKLVKKTNGVFVVLAGDTVSYKPGQSYRFWIEADEDRIRVSIDDNLIFSVQNFEVEAGRLALYTLAGTEARFDNLSVNSYRYNHVPTLIVDGPANGIVDQPLTYFLDWTDQDGDPIYLTVPEGTPGLSFDTKTFEWTASQVGDYKLVFKASDNIDTISRFVRLRITSGVTETRRSR